MHPPKSGDDEERYFHELQAEQRRKLREQMESAAAELEQNKRVAGAVGSLSTDIGQRIRKLGFDGETARAFDLLPLVHVAWADGRISRAERGMILDALAARGLGPDSPAFVTLAALLEQRPSQAFMDESLAILRELIGDGGRAADLVELCHRLAQASGGLLGLGNPVSDAERTLLQSIAERFGKDAEQALRNRLA